MFALPYFEQQLVMYVTSDDKSTFETPFDISKIPIVTREQADAEDRTKKLTATTPSLKPPKTGPTKMAPSAAEAAASATAVAQKYAQELAEIPEIREFGNVLKSSPVIELTEAETEYVVSVVKHIFKEHIVLQYDIKNTLPSTILENVSVLATPSDDEGLEDAFVVQAEKLETDVPGKVYVAFRKVNGEGSMPVTTFSNVLKFTSKEIDPTTNEPEETGYEDEYEVSDFDLSGSDYIIPTFASNFAHVWEQVGAQGEEAEETLQLSGMKSIAGMLTLLKLFGGEPVLTVTLRGYGAISQGTIPPAGGGHGCPYQPVNTHPQVAGQDGQRRQGGGQRADGLLVQDRSYHQDYGQERGRRCRRFGGGICCVMMIGWTHGVNYLLLSVFFMLPLPLMRMFILRGRIPDRYQSCIGFTFERGLFQSVAA
jgi:Vesicle coat complex COPI, gamma subunit